MLERPRTPAETRQERRRALRRAKKARYRTRRRAGEMIVPLKVDFWILEALIAEGWLAEWDAGDRRRVAEAAQSRENFWSRYDA